MDEDQARYLLRITELWNGTKELEIIRDKNKNTSPEYAKELEKKLLTCYHVNVEQNAPADLFTGNAFSSQDSEESSSTIRFGAGLSTVIVPSKIFSDRVIYSLEKIIELEPEDRVFQYMLIEKYLESQMLGKAESTLLKAEQDKNRTPKLDLLWSKYYLKNNNLEKCMTHSIMYFDRANKIWGDNYSPEISADIGAEKVVSILEPVEIGEFTYFIRKTIRDYMLGIRMDAYTTSEISNKKELLEELNDLYHERNLDAFKFGGSYALSEKEFWRENTKTLSDALKSVTNTKILIKYLENSLLQTNDPSIRTLVLMKALESRGGSISDHDLNLKFMNLLSTDLSLKSPKEYVGGFKKFGNSTNLVESLDRVIEEDLYNQYIIKTNNPEIGLIKERERLKSEYITLVFLSTVMENEAIHPLTGKFDPRYLKVPQPIAYFEDENHFLHIQKKIKSQSLAEKEPTADKGKLISEMFLLLENIGVIHHMATRALRKDATGYYVEVADSNGNSYRTRIKKFEYEENLITRAVGSEEKPRLGMNAALEEFIQEYKIIMPTQPLNYFLHGDLYLSNALEGGFIIDWDKKCVGDPTIDLAHLIENPEIEDLDSGILFNYYISHVLDKKLADWKDLTIMRNNYPFSKLHTSLCLIGANVVRDNKEHALAYLEKSMITMEDLNLQDLKNAFVQYIKATPHDFLKQAL